MRRGTIFIVLFVGVAAAIVALTQVFRAQPALEVVVVTDPLAERWVRDAAARFNEQGVSVGVGQRVRVTVQTLGDMTAFAGQQGWTQANHPDGWVAAWSGVVSSSSSVGAGVTKRTLSESLARSTMVWMSRQSAASRVPEVTWAGVRAAAEAGHDLALPAADTTVQGFAALVSGVAQFAERGVLEADALGDPARAFLLPVVDAVPNYTTVGADPALTMSGTTGSTYAAGMAAENQWLSQLGVLAGSTPRFGYPEWLVVFDFPMYGLESTTQTAEEREAVRLFAEYLQTPDQQNNAMGFGLRPAKSEPPADHPLFSQGAQYGIAAALSPMRAVTLPPNRSALNSFAAWASNAQR
ncbi:MAG: substrate-binding domain-containing protein [Anaerolineae bacterium]|nr:substrate-binding domain-containing protein [Anaerolineae bacterium]